MRITHYHLSALLVLLLIAGGTLLAQSETCIVVIEGQNRNRTVDGTITAECAPVRYPVQWHDPPWGNWGVSSNYGRKSDTDQFKGWELKDGKDQWNSCTVGRFAPPHEEFYRAPDHRSQWSESIVTHGRKGVRNDILCPDPDDRYATPPAGCTTVRRKRVTESTNYMTIYELDFPDRDDLIETLYFPETSATLRSCTYTGCTEVTSDWVDMESSTSRTVIVEADLRMKVKAELLNDCDWVWPR